MPSLLLSFWNNYMLHSPWHLQSGFWISSKRPLNCRTLLWLDHAYFETLEVVFSIPFKRMIWGTKGCTLESTVFYAGGVNSRFCKFCMGICIHMRQKAEQCAASTLSAGSALGVELMDTVAILLLALSAKTFFIWSEKIDLIPYSRNSRWESLGLRLQSKVLGWDLKK